MGGTFWQKVRAETSSWTAPHSLCYDVALRQKQLRLLDNFSATLKLCFMKRVVHRVRFEHWFLWDGFWYMEFGNGLLLNNTVNITNTQKDNFQVVAEFEVSVAVRRRMEEVCGATGYSMAFRNCEHMARYIYSGDWTCVQQLTATGWRRLLVIYLTAVHGHINQLPQELVTKPALFPADGGPLRWRQKGHLAVDKANQTVNSAQGSFSKLCSAGQKESSPPPGKEKAGSPRGMSLKRGVELCADGLKQGLVYVLVLLLLAHICVRYLSSGSVLDARMFHLLSRGTQLES